MSATAPATDDASQPRTNTNPFSPQQSSGDSSSDIETGGVVLAPFSFERLTLRKEDVVISDPVFGVKTAPGHLEQTYVGHFDWLESWFPHDPQHITLKYDMKGVQRRFSIPEAILVKNFGYFSSSLRYGAEGLRESALREFCFPDTEAAAMGLIISFLMTGTFPQHHMAEVQPMAQLIGDFITAYRVASYLDLRCRERFNYAVCLRLRQILLADRQVLSKANIGQLYNFVEGRQVDNNYKDLRTVVAQAAVKPWMQSWMGKSAQDTRTSASTISCSMAFDETCGKDPKAWATIVNHYLDLIGNSKGFAADVMRQTQKTMQGAKRINKVAIAQDGPNKKIHTLPVHADCVTYRDPLPVGKEQTFTI
ncbi:hypothetical protein CkaCkLH20_02482 [Colletotrichum karsti]|uniref:BTB domain-containing protein n=1 Tax=Colletotrichum karsti TaxID=1095194 RepID=A0A9P6ID59_9PEZI|nr:uncharacterized protein CkaCkLH20_02482 [Colletotrichum karsti]KAF9879671.1 hypothetical protein CkaCkLH20_02482 [Colletotrichum karsti]